MHKCFLKDSHSQGWGSTLLMYVIIMHWGGSVNHHYNFIRLSSWVSIGLRYSVIDMIFANADIYRLLRCVKICLWQELRKSVCTAIDRHNFEKLPCGIRNLVLNEDQIRRWLFSATEHCDTALVYEVVSFLGHEYLFTTSEWKLQHLTTCCCGNEWTAPPPPPHPNPCAANCLKHLTCTDLYGSPWKIHFPAKISEAVWLCIIQPGYIILITTKQHTCSGTHVMHHCITNCPSYQTASRSNYFAWLLMGSGMAAVTSFRI